LGHRRRRAEAIPLLRQKYEQALRLIFPEPKAERLFRLVAEEEAFWEMAVDAFLEAFVHPAGM
ncbi:MAG: 2-methylcitrate dehydratase, partial [Rhodothermia bacterium]|nr:2-methylcitrate dehydratase [Rhodothermia bacterium]